MKKTNCYILSLLMAAALTACSSDVDQGSTNGLTPISLTATVEDAEVTRAGTTENNAFSSGDAFTAYFPTDVRVGSTTSASSTSFSYNGTKWTPATQPYFNAGTSSATIHAYYGKVGGSSGTQVTNSTGTFTVATDQSTSAGYKASDLMYATTNIAKTSPTAALTFQHKMAKIIVSATAGSGISKITEVRIIGGHRSINVTMPDCTLGTTLTDDNTSSSYITMYSGGTAATAECAALVVPEASGFTGDFLEIVTDQGSVKYSLTNKVLNSGKSYTFVLAVTAAAIGSTVSITNWTETSGATVTAGGGDFTIGDISAYTYDGNAKTPTPTVKYSTTTLTKDTDYTLQYVANTAAGTAAVIAIGKGSYVGKVGVKEFTINKADATYTAPSYVSSSLTYNSSAQTLISAGTSPTGTTMQYALGTSSAATGEWSTTLPTGTDASTYYVWYKIDGGTNYNDVAATKISDSKEIAKATPTLSLSTSSMTFSALNSSQTFTITYDGDGALSATSSNSSYATASLSSKTVTVSSNAWGSATITVSAAAGTNYKAATSQTVSVEITECTGTALASATVGMIICEHGKAYDMQSNPTGSLPCGGAKKAIIAYVGNGEANSSYNRGLALSMSDLTSGADTQWRSSGSGTDLAKQYGSWSNDCLNDLNGLSYTDVLIGKGASYPAAQKISDYRTSCSVPSGCSSWFLPTIGQWSLILQGLTGKNTALSTGTNNDYKGGAINTILQKYGGTSARMNSDSGGFWSSTENRADHAWYMGFARGYADYYGKTSGSRVRAVLAF